MTDLSDIEILSGHIDEATAYVVDDYPYSFRLRCTIRYWIESHPKRGDRLVSQTTNPKVAGEVWNKPKKSTYSPIGVMTRNGEGHIGWTGLGLWPSAERMAEFRSLSIGHLTGAQQQTLLLIHALAEAEARHKAMQEVSG